MFIFKVCWVCFMICDKVILAASTIKYEEYVVEHEISTSQAKSAALSISHEPKNIPGCNTCTETEMKYCLGQGLIRDHCCCDKRYHEELPYVPHTCYFGKQLCVTVLRDCVEYSRVKTCCCDAYVIDKWKQKSNVTRLVPNNFMYTVISVVLYIFYIS